LIVRTDHLSDGMRQLSLPMLAPITPDGHGATTDVPATIDLCAMIEELAKYGADDTITGG